MLLREQRTRLFFINDPRLPLRRTNAHCAQYGHRDLESSVTKTLVLALGVLHRLLESCGKFFCHFDVLASMSRVAEGSFGSEDR